MPAIHQASRYLGLIVSIALTPLALSACNSAIRPALLGNAPSTKATLSERSALSEPIDPAIIQLDDRREKTAEIKVEPAGFKTLDQPLEFSSTVESPADTTGAIYSLVNGVVTRILVNAGDTVTKGQIVAYVNSPDIAEGQATYLHALSKIKECQAAKNLIKTRIELSRRDESRLSSLVKDGIAAQKEVEAARGRVTGTQSEMVAADSALLAAEAQLRAARSRIKSLGLDVPTQEVDNVTSELPIKSPISGIITQRFVNPGQTVGPASLASGAKSSAIAAVADLSKVWVMLEVPQSQVSRIKQGARVNFRTEVAPGKIYTGTVTRLGQSFDAVSHTALVRTEIPNHNFVLKPGMLVIATVEGMSKSLTKPTIALSAVQNIDGQDYVFVSLGEHRYKKRLVHCGDRTSSAVIIDSGLTPGEPIVVNGSFTLKTESVKASMGAQ
ncbi:MAG: efflux RND transporter periplasmic adaptor subunit [Candidatus Obscuribacter sp.]|nr:efflux RND transporter periplasmic adaptor subunit [Candidatus Obscuribacter sp.]